MKDLILETKAGKFYATKGTSSTNSYLEIGYYDEDGNMIPVAAIEAKTKEINKKIDEKAIWRTIYNPEDPDNYEQVIINK